jgi:pimeloyl-ACP methyl ester carboxylesterase
LYVALYETDLIPQLPFVISQLKSSAAGAIIDELARQGISFASTAATAQAAAVLCYDRGAFLHDDDGKRILKEHPNDGTILLLTALTCSDVDVAAAPPGFNDPVRSDIPTLVLAGEYDPVTPPDQSRHASESLSHSTFVLFPGMGHSEVFASPECPEIIFRAFLADPLANVDTSCIASMGPPNWNVG